jgi:hypothetical protein
MQGTRCRHVKRSASIDWEKKEQVRALLRRNIRRLLAKYRYPPDKQESAIALVNATGRTHRHRSRRLKG